MAQAHDNPPPDVEGSERTESAFPHLTTGGTETEGAVVGDPPEDSQDYQPLPYPVVGIGASAGGVEAYLQLLDALPADTGMTFVLIPHLSREHESHLVEIMSRHTPMKVTDVQHGEQPAPNTVYVLPPNRWVRLESGRFVLEARPARGLSLPINYFFKSLAADQKSRAIGVVLSGNDGDGAVGLSEIKSEGGISIVQAPETAQFGDMPRASIAADHVDLILSPGQIGAELARLAHQFARRDLRILESGTGESQEADFLRILTMLRGVSGIHFRQYKPSTLRRRITRRMVLERVETFGEYVRFLQSNPRELLELQEDVLINVTRFFRDADVFEALKSDIFPRLLERRETDQQIRIWAAGCSTGQEAYSIAMCLLELLSSLSLELPIQVFGTDASELSIGKARLGIYPETIVSDVTPERLRRFFSKVDKGYQVVKRVRDLCIFARQNLCVDPPFSRIDLVSCRNVLIYFGTELQNHVVPMFHYSLRPNGYLLLGASESIRGYGHLFQQLDRKHKYFVRLDAPSRLYLETVTRVPQQETAKSTPVAGADNWAELELQRAADRIVLARYGPPGVVINEKSEIVQLRGHTRPYLEMSPGIANLQLLRMLPESVAVALREVLARAIKLGVPARVDRVNVTDATQSFEIAVEVLPIPSLVVSRAPCFLVLFVPQGQRRETYRYPPLSPLPEPSDGSDSQVVRLKEDLEANRLYLQALLDDRDAKNQELISANEEVQSANEELQSTNEELETTKEELQSANEELQTVNEELRQRNSVLTQATNDLSNLLNSVSLPVLMLSSDLHIRHFTPPTQRLTNLRSTDIGRPLGNIRMNFSVPNLDQIFAEVLDSLAPREMEIQDQEGRWHLLRVRPYRTTDNKIDGLVVVLVDIDQFRRSQQELRDSRDFARSVIENVPLPVAVLNVDFRVRTVNEAFRKLPGASTDVFEGRSFPDLVRSYWGMQEIRSHLENLRDQDTSTARFHFEHETASEPKRIFRVSGCLLQPDHDKALLITIEDTTATTEAKRLANVERAQLAEQIQSATQQLGQTQEELRALAARLIQSQEDERRRVARELHDDVSQKLALLANDSHMLSEQKLAEADAKKTLDRFTSRIGELSETVRGISHRLHPAIIEDLGLATALKNLVEEFAKRETMPVTFSGQDIPEDLSLEVSTSLYRIAQEALRNVSKYAGRTHVRVSLIGSDAGLRLEVADFGEGFDSSTKRMGLGLLSMAERARLVGGTFAVESALGRGTRITVLVPADLSAESPA